MKTLVRTAFVFLCLCGAAQAMPGTADRAANGDLRRVDRIHALHRLDGWRAVDADTVIVWATPFRPYLVELSRPSRDLKFANVIGVTSTAGNVYERFDSVVVDGLRYPIAAIYEMDPATARHFKAA